MLQHSNRTLENEENKNNWKKLKNRLSEADKVETTGAGLGATYGILTSIPDLGESAEEHSEQLEIGEIDLENTLKTIDDSLQENIWDNIWGYERKADNLIEAIPLMADKVGHYGVGYFMGKQGVKVADKLSGEYDPKKAVLGGLLAVGIYGVCKEGLFEGGSGIQFDLDNPDIYADWAMDTTGMLHSTYNFHKRKTAENGEEPKGVMKQIYNAGKKYGKATSNTEPRGKSFKFNNSTDETGYLTGNNEEETNIGPENETSSLTETLGEYLSQIGGSDPKYVESQGRDDDLPEPDYIDLDDI